MLNQPKKSLIRDINRSRLCDRQSVVTIGSFDGVHIGHQAILQQVIDKAKSTDSLAVAMTFEPQPQEYFPQKQRRHD